MQLRFTRSGHLFISAQDNCNDIVDAMLATNYNEDFCLADDFDSEFTARLMEAGFLVMSICLGNDDEDEKPFYLMCPKLHLERSALFFENLHVKKSIRRFLNKYELRPGAEFERIIDRCVEKHGADWLTPPLVECIKKIKTSRRSQTSKGSQISCSEAMPENRLTPEKNACPVSFALYRNGKLAAGEFGIVCGSVYTSYSGFYDEDNAGTVQLILAARYLQEQGFLFFDLGMPMDYKNDLGAVNISPDEFVYLFRSAQKPNKGN